METSLSPQIAERLRAVAAETLRSGPVNLSAVAKQTGVPRSTLYYNFKGAEELTRWFVDELLTELGGQIAATVEAEPDPVAQLDAAVNATMAVTIEQPALTGALLSSVFSGPDFADRLRWTRDTVFPAVRETLRRGIADGSFLDVDVDEAIAALIGIIAVVSLHHLGTLGPADPQLPPNDSVTLFLHSLRNPTAARRSARSSVGRIQRSS
jgi:AcrR family transcriptional regulator